MGVSTDFINRLFNKYRIETFFIVCIIFSAIVSVILFFKTSSEISAAETSVPTSQKIETSSRAKITVDISGSVINPDIYEVDANTRIKEVIDMAGGLSADAATVFVYRNINMARIVTDQEKIYIPSAYEIQTGIFTEKQRYLDYLAPQQSKPVESDNTSDTKALIPLNTATATELDTLPGVGKTTAEKIIQNRPFTAKQELVDKKIVSQKVFDGIKDSIEL